MMWTTSASRRLRAVRNETDARHAENKKAGMVGGAYDIRRARDQLPRAARVFRPRIAPMIGFDADQDCSGVADAAVAAGAGFVCRYLKNLTLGEAKALIWMTCHPESGLHTSAK